MVDKTDPVCGMQGHIPRHGHYFCGEHCVKVYEKENGIVSPNEEQKKASWKDYTPLAIIIGLILLTTSVLTYRDFSLASFTLEKKSHIS